MVQMSIHDENVKVLNFLRASSRTQCSIISPIEESELERARIIQRRIAHTYSRPPHSLSLERRRRRRVPSSPDFSSVLRCRELAYSADDPREIHTYLGGPRGEQVLRFALRRTYVNGTRCVKRARICGMPTCGRVEMCRERRRRPEPRSDLCKQACVRRAPLAAVWLRDTDTLCARRFPHARTHMHARASVYLPSTRTIVRIAYDAKIPLLVTS